MRRLTVWLLKLGLLGTVFALPFVSAQAGADTIASFNQAVQGLLSGWFW
ncbi:MAG: hypothetical protein WD646_01685 [Actinomycetota bacterium]